MPRIINSPVHSVQGIDGDTFRIVIDLGFNVLTKVTCRLDGVDAPETKTSAGLAVASVASMWIVNVMSRGKNRLFWRSTELEKVTAGTQARFDLYGRSLGTFFDDNEPQATLTHYLSTHGLVKSMKSKRPNWTIAELDEVEKRCKELLK